MNITLSNKAIEWFHNEMLVEEGDSIRFYVRYGGSSPLHDSFALGVTKEEPIEMIASSTANGVTYFIEERDLWFFDGHDLSVEFDETYKEPKYEYHKK